MKYLIALFGDQATMVETRSTEWIKSMIAFMGEVDQELADRGERVDAVGLADPTQAKTVRFIDGAPVAIDEARVLEIASKIVAFIEGPVEVRQVMDAPPEEFTG